jgi:hypothetical protein
MKFCGSLNHGIKQQRCETQIGGLKKIYLINALDFHRADNTTIILNRVDDLYEIDAVKNSASITQNTIRNNDSYFVESVLSFNIFKNSEHFLTQEESMVTSMFKVLVEYYDGTWLLIDESPEFFFRFTLSNKTSGVNTNDFNGVVYQYTMRGHGYGIDYKTKPIIKSKEAEWVLISEYCERYENCEFFG